MLCQRIGFIRHTDYGYSCEWTGGQSQITFKKAEEYNAIRKTTCRSLSQDCSSSSTTSTSTTSLQQDVVDPTSRPAMARSHSTSSRELGDQFRESTKIKKLKNQDEDIDRVLGDLLRDLSDWLDEFTENLVDENTVQAVENWETSSENPQKSKNSKIKMRILIEFWETCCATCLIGWTNSQRISWTKGFHLQGTHPQALPANDIHKLVEKWYRASTVFILTSRRTQALKCAKKNQNYTAHCRKRGGEPYLATQWI